jgi:PEP-CTERM motif
MNQRRMHVLAVLGLGLGLGERVTEAVPVTWEFSGEIAIVTDIDNDLGGAITVGTPFSGSFTFESNTPDGNPSVAVGRYDNPVTAISGSIGASAFTGSGAFGSQIGINDSPVGDTDIFGLGVQNLIAPDFNGVFSFSLGYAGSSGTLLESDALPLFPADLDATDTAPVLFRWDRVGDDILIAGELTVLVPEPGSIALLALGAIAIARRRRSPRSVGVFVVVLVIGLVLGLGERAAEAGPVTWEFSGEIAIVTDIDNDLGGAITVGTPFSGSFTFDFATPDGDPSIVAGRYNNAITAISGRVGAYAFSGTGAFNSVIRITDSPGGDNDAFVFGMGDILFPDFGGVFSLSFLLSNADGSAFASDALPEIPPDLVLFSGPRMTFSAEPGRAAFVGDVVALVPEPGTLVLLGFGALALARRRKSYTALRAFVLCMTLPTLTLAGPVTWEFNGEIRDFVDADRILGGAINVGTPFSGSFTFETTTPESDPDSARSGVYDGAVTAISGQIGGSPFFQPDEFGSGIVVRSSSSVGGENDDFALWAEDINFPAFGSVFRFSFFIADIDGTVFTSDSLPLIPPTLTESNSGMTFTIDGGRTAMDGRLTTLVPEPGSLALLALGAIAIARRRRSPRSVGVFAVVLLMGLVFGLGERTADAGPVTWDFAGEIGDVFDPDNDLGRAVTVGTPFSGSFTFDTTTPDSVPGNARLGVYDDAVLAISGQIGDLLFFGTEGFSSSISIIDQAMGVDNDAFSLSVVGVNVADLAAVFSFSLIFGDTDGSLFSNDGLPLQPPSNIEPALAPGFTFSSGPEGAAMDGRLTTLVPEPCTLALLGLGGLHLARPRRSRYW